MQKRSGKIQERVIISTFFIVAMIVRFGLANYDKSYVLINDEGRYFDMARNMWNGNFMQFMNIPFDYQKLGYSLLIAPVFAVEDASARICVIMFINSVCMASSVIPLWLISKRTGLQTKYALTACALFLLHPIHLYSQTFLSEILYVPLFLWAVYLWYVLGEAGHGNMGIAATYGVMLFYLYFTKEVSLVLILGPVVMLGQNLMKTVFLDKNTIKNWYKRNRGRMTYQFIVPFLVFLALHIVTKMTVFTGTGNSYVQTSLSVFKNKNIILLLTHYALCYTAGTVVDFMLLPLMIRRSSIDYLSGRQRELLQYSEVLILLTAAVNSFTIMVREDYAMYDLFSPRVIVRYIAPMMSVYFVLLCCVWQKTALGSDGRKEVSLSSKNKILLKKAGCFFMIGMLLFYYRTPSVSSHVDVVNCYISYILRFGIAAVIGNTHACDIIMNAMILGFMWLTWRRFGKKKKKTIICLIAFMLLTNILGQNFIKERYILHPAEVETREAQTIEHRDDALAVSDFIRAHEEDNIMILQESMAEHVVFVTYMDECDWENVYMVNAAMVTKEDTGRICWTEEKSVSYFVHSVSFSPEYEGVSEVHYYITCTDEPLNLKNVELVETISDSIRIYRNLVPEILEW